jgi:hypothetical protein
LGSKIWQSLDSVTEECLQTTLGSVFSIIDGVKPKF